jgi:RND superfamily putative drug exporter
VAVLTLGGSAHSRFQDAQRIQALNNRFGPQGIQVWLTGYSPIARDLSNVEITDTEHAELIGVPTALLILLIALGAPLASLLPLLLAGFGLGVTYGMLALMAQLVSLDSLVLAISTMIGVGIGIDYSLFIVSRFREEIAQIDPKTQQQDVVNAVARTVATSGATIVSSGVIVALSLLSLFAVRIPLFHEVAFGCLAVVACMLGAGLTLLPACLALLGSRINAGTPVRPHRSDARTHRGQRPSGWTRWTLAIMRRPWISAGATIAVLALVAIPALGMNYGVNLGVLTLSNTASGKGERVLTHEFAAGAVSPIQIVATRQDEQPLTLTQEAKVKRLGEQIENDHRVSGVAERKTNKGVLLTVVPSVAIDSNTASALVGVLRTRLAPQAAKGSGLQLLVGGTTAVAADVSHEASAKLPTVVGIVLAFALLFLLLTFRSIVLPLKAVVLNVLSTGATMGLVVLVFQQGVGSSVLGFTSTGFIQAYLPLTVFAVLFGLSMDYEVFLIRRMQEERQNGADNCEAITAGVEHTGRPITAAAAIMFAVFGSFVSAGILELKQFGFALAVAVAIDATLIRLLLVPALMRLLGDASWWLPSRLSRLLPSKPHERVNDASLLSIATHPLNLKSGTSE